VISTGFSPQIKDQEWSLKILSLRSVLRNLELITVLIFSKRRCLFLEDTEGWVTKELHTMMFTIMTVRPLNGRKLRFRGDKPRIQEGDIAPWS